MIGQRKEVREPGTAEYLEKALDDFDRARTHAAEELRSMMEDAKDRVLEWQRQLDGASDEVRRELGVLAVRAQRSPTALKEMSEEIKHHRKELKHDKEHAAVL